MRYILEFSINLFFEKDKWQPWNTLKKLSRNCWHNQTSSPINNNQKVSIWHNHTNAVGRKNKSSFPAFQPHRGLARCSFVHLWRELPVYSPQVSPKVQKAPANVNKYFLAKHQEGNIYISDITLHFYTSKRHNAAQCCLLSLIPQLILKTRMSNDSCLEIIGKYVRKTFEVNYYNESVVKTVYFMGPKDTEYLSSSQERVSVN